jgi:apolipoprotein D and lipocalin family protein
VLRWQYVIGWLADDGSQTLVVRDARDHLWYMARTPEVSAADYAAMLRRAAAMGYDTGRIERVPQSAATLTHKGV